MNEPQAKPSARPVGRPPVNGRRVIVKLTAAEIDRARALGNGSISNGIRAALSPQDTAATLPEPDSA